MATFPWRNHNHRDIYKDLNSLKKRLNRPICFPITICKFGYKCTDNFFQEVRLDTRSFKNIKCTDYWLKHQDKILAESERGGKDLFGTVVYMRRAPAHFSPYAAGVIYKHFQAKKVFDPYAGWGDRCLAAIALDIDYLGVDSNSRLTPCYQEMINFFHASNVNFICDKSENVNTDYFHPDLIFSSPPFWSGNNLVEEYDNCESNFNKFFNESICVLFDKYLRRVPIVLYVNDQLYKAIISKYGECTHLFMLNSGKVGKNNRTVHTIYSWV